jgi:hypothetical protein
MLVEMGVSQTHRASSDSASSSDRLSASSSVECAEVWRRGQTNRSFLSFARRPRDSLPRSLLLPNNGHIVDVPILSHSLRNH